MSVWECEERAALLKKLWFEGLSGSVIAKQIGNGVTRNAVIGRAYRMGWKREVQPIPARIRSGMAEDNHPGNQGRRRQPPKPKAPKVSPQYSFLGVNSGRRAASKQGSERTTLPRVPVDASHARPWTERAFGQCAYPISGEGADTFSCCAPTSANYCKAHAAIMFKPVPAEDNKRLMRLARVA